MVSDSSDDDLTFEKVSSQEEAKLYTEVPSDTNYKFILKNSSGKAYSLMTYTLSQGKKLPYSTSLKGLTLQFNFGFTCGIWMPTYRNRVVIISYIRKGARIQSDSSA